MLAISADGKATSVRAHLDSVGLDEAAKIHRSKLPMSSKDCGIPQRLPYQTRKLFRLSSPEPPLVLTLGREKWPHKTRLPISRLDE